MRRTTTEVVSRRRVWQLIREPRIRTAAATLFWGAVLVMGVSALEDPPVTIETHAGPVLTIIWGGFLVIGGTLGFGGCLAGWWWVERAAITAAATGFSIDLCVIVSLHLTGPTPRVVQAGFIVLALFSMVLRWTEIRGPQLDPSRGCRSR